MQFEITNNPPDKTYLGQIITYKIGILPMVKTIGLQKLRILKTKSFS